VTFLKCGGQLHDRLCQKSFRSAIAVIICSFLAELLTLAASSGERLHNGIMYVLSVSLSVPSVDSSSGAQLAYRSPGARAQNRTVSMM